MIALRPRSLDEAVRHLEGDPNLLPVAGCTDLMVRGPEALHRIDRVIDLLGIPELRGIREVDGGLEIGAATTFTEIRSSAAVRAAFPALVDAAAQVGGWQIQNRATLGGNM
ncbi:MAG: FAD binding domain-containing protein, partial [Acidobacteriota bacterium]